MTDVDNSADYLFMTSVTKNNEAIIRAAEAGNLAKVKLLLQDNDIDVNWKHGPGGRPSLHGAAREGHVAVAKTLVEAGADVNMRDRYGCTALWWATARTHPETAAFLLARGSTDICTKVRWGYAAITLAAERDEAMQEVHFTMLREALRSKIGSIGDANGWSRLHMAVRGALWNEGLVRAAHWFSGWRQVTALRRKYIEDLMKSCDVHDINARDRFGMTPLHHAVRGQLYHRDEKLYDDMGGWKDYGWMAGVRPSMADTDIIKLLIQRGADVLLKDNRGWTARHHALYFEQMEAIEILEEEQLKNTDRDTKSDSNAQPEGLWTNEIPQDTIDVIQDIKNLKRKGIKHYIKSNGDQMHNIQNLLKLKGLGPILRYEPGMLRVCQQVELLLERLMSKMNELDPKLQLCADRGGSTSEGTKIGLPDEFDTRLQLRGLQEVVEVVDEDNKGNVMMELKEDCMNSGWLKFCTKRKYKEVSNTVKECQDCEMEKDDHASGKCVKNINPNIQKAGNTSGMTRDVINCKEPWRSKLHQCTENRSDKVIEKEGWFIDALLLFTHLHSLMYEALTDTGLWDKLNFYWKPFGRNEIFLQWMGSTAHGMPIKIDLLYCVVGHGWWPSKARRRCGILRGSLEARGWCVLLRPRYWSPTPCRLDREVMRAIPMLPRLAYSLCKLCCHLVEFKTKCFTVKSYDLKNALMYELEKDIEQMKTRPKSSFKDKFTADSFLSAASGEDCSELDVKEGFTSEIPAYANIESVDDLSDDQIEMIKHWALRICDSGLAALRQGDRSYYFNLGKWSPGNHNEGHEEQIRLLDIVKFILAEETLKGEKRKFSEIDLNGSEGH